MIISLQGKELLKRLEGLRLEAYQCSAKKWTIGWGHTGDVKKGNKITQHQAEVILEHDLQVYEAVVQRCCPKATGPQFSAMVCLAFNIGAHNFAESTLVKCFQRGDVSGAAGQFAVWNKITDEAGKKIVDPGLVKRRALERLLFLEVPS